MKSSHIPQSFLNFNEEHGACGVMMAADVQGNDSIELMQQVMQAFKDLGKRSGVHWDGTGDGAGSAFFMPVALHQQWLDERAKLVSLGSSASLDSLSSLPRNNSSASLSSPLVAKAGSSSKSNDEETEIPVSASNLQLAELVGPKLVLGEYGAGSIFLPAKEKADHTGLTPSQHLINKVLTKHKFDVLCWKKLEADKSKITSQKARDALPDLQTVIFVPKTETSGPVNKAELQRRIVEAHIELDNVAKAQGHDVFVCSLSNYFWTIKGMLRNEELAEVYPILRTLGARVVLVHGRMSTGTGTNPKNAQPGGDGAVIITHNGEMNTYQQNRLFRVLLRRELLGREDALNTDGLSDSLHFGAQFAEAIADGWDPLQYIEWAMPRIVEPNDPRYDKEERAMYELFRRRGPAYGGPALVLFATGNLCGAALDNCGLRPARIAHVRHKENGNEQLIVASEYNIDENKFKVLGSYHLGAGEKIALEFDENGKNGGRILFDADIRKRLLAQKPEGYASFEEKLKAETLTLPETGAPEPKYALPLHKRQHAAFMEQADVQMLLQIATDGMEPIGAMGDQTSPAKPHAGLITDHLVQDHAQVTNPPLDSKNEAHQFTMKVRLGANLQVAEKLQKEATRLTTGELKDKQWRTVPSIKRYELESPIIKQGELARIEQLTELKPKMIDITADIEQGVAGQEQALRRICLKAEEAVVNGSSLLILSDRELSEERASLQAAAVVAAVTKHLEEQGLRLRTSLIVDSGQIRNEHDAAMLLTLGASAVYPGMLYETVRYTYHTNPGAFKNGKKPESLEKAYEHVQKGYHKAIMKTMGRNGINDVENYIGGRFCSGIDIDTDPQQQSNGRPSLSTFATHTLFSGIPSPLSGYKLHDFMEASLRMHGEATTKQWGRLPNTGKMAWTRDGLAHNYEPKVVTYWSAMLEEQAAENLKTPAPKRGEDGNRLSKEYIDAFRPTAAFRTFSRKMAKFREEHPISYSDYLEINPEKLKGVTPIALNDPNLQSVSSIIQSAIHPGGISFGATGRPYWETVIKAFNALGGNSAAGEGGVPADNYGTTTMPSTIQFASARFGFGAELMATAKAIQIKLAQGAKPGEGGQLPAVKNTPAIAATRGGVPGVPLISPPPHHSEYSIEDLKRDIEVLAAGLYSRIYVLMEEQENAEDKELLQKSIDDLLDWYGKIDVKTASKTGMASIVAGIAKTLASSITIDGNQGGTGAAGVNGRFHTGQPAEIALWAADQALRKANFRVAEPGKFQALKLRVSNGIQTVDDFVKLVFEGMDEGTLGTAIMMSGGCKMLQKCNQANGCKPGVANSEQFYASTPEELMERQRQVELYVLNMAAGIRERLASLGFRSISEACGRVDMLRVRPEAPERIRFERLIEPRVPTTPVPQKVLEDRAHALKDRKDNKLVHLARKTVDEVRMHNKIAAPLVLTPHDTGFGVALATEMARRNVRGKYAYEKPQPTQQTLVLKDEAQQQHVIGINRSVPLPEPKAGQRHLAKQVKMHIANQPELADKLAKRPKVYTIGNSGSAYAFAGYGVKFWNSGSTQNELASHFSDGEVVYTPKVEDRQKAFKALAGNNTGFGASGGLIVVNGLLGERTGVCLSGATIVANGTGDKAFEFARQGSLLVLGRVGRDFGTGAQCGVAIVYDPDNTLESKISHEHVVIKDAKDAAKYHDAIYKLMRLSEKKILKTEKHNEPEAKPEDELHVQQLLNSWEQNKQHFRVVVSKLMDNVNTLKELRDFAQTFIDGPTELSPFMKVWWEDKQTQLVKGPYTQALVKQEAPRVEQIARTL